MNKTQKRDAYIIGGGIGALLLSVIILSKQQIHILFEALAIPFGIFFTWYGLTKVKGIYRWIFTIFGAGNIIIDGFLLLQNYGVI